MSWGWHLSPVHIAKALRLFISLAIVWLAVMFVINWYDPRFHLLATSTSTLMTVTCKSGGIVEKLVN